MSIQYFWVVVLSITSLEKRSREQEIVSLKSIMVDSNGFIMRSPSLHTDEPTLSLPAARVGRHSTCRKRRAECRRRTSSSCRTSWDGWSPSGQSQSPKHPALDQTPKRHKHKTFIRSVNTTNTSYGKRELFVFLKAKKKKKKVRLLDNDRNQ